MNNAIHATASRWRYDYPMSRLSSWGVGGAAKRLFSPESVDDLPALFADEKEVYTVGYGSNLLVRDGGVDGVVVRTAPGIAALRLEEDGRVFAAAGVGCPKLARFCVANKLSGAEFFIGIPGTVGGALAMNAGCHGGEIWDWVDAVSLITHDGEMQIRRREDFSVTYRCVKNKSELFFSGAWFRFNKNDAGDGDAKLRELLRLRAQMQPIGEASAGSVFCNPPNDYAGRLLEAAGMKGVSVGEAQVSSKHANFIITTSGATAADVESLILLMQRCVYETAGVRLRVEVCIIGAAA